MRVKVDPDRCQGHTLCAMAAPDVFVLSDFDGHSSVCVDVVPAELEEAVRGAVNTCPERAIEIED